MFGRLSSACSRSLPLGALAVKMDNGNNDFVPDRKEHHGKNPSGKLPEPS